MDLPLPVPDFGYGDLNSTTKSHPGASNVSVNQLLLLSWITMKDKQLRSICSNSLKKPRFAKSNRFRSSLLFWSTTSSKLVLKQKRPNQLIVALFCRPLKPKAPTCRVTLWTRTFECWTAVAPPCTTRTSLHLLLQRDFDWESPMPITLLLKISTTNYFPFCSYKIALT